MEDYSRYLQKLESTSFDESSNDSTTDSTQNSNLFKNNLDLPIKSTKANLRLPTRRPDPNVYNRNALLARENRRRKKAQLEEMEKDLEEARRVNQNLLKVLKKQNKTVKKLEEEKKYYRGLLTNSSEIQVLLTALNCRLPRLSQQSEGLQFKQQESLNIFKSPTISMSSSCSYSSSCSNANDPEQEVFSTKSSQTDSLPEQILREDTFISPDYNSTSSSVLSNDIFTNNDYSFLDSWNECDVQDENCINNEFDFSRHAQDSSIKVPVVSGKQNVAPPSLDKMLELSENSNDVGICLHIGHGKVSLEFCPDCHFRACQSLPDELL